LFYVTIEELEECSSSVRHPSSAEYSSGSDSETSSAEYNACDQQSKRKKEKDMDESMRGNMKEKRNHGQGCFTKKVKL
jgi:hypothetical protein